MNTSKIAKALGRRGGLARAKKLSGQKRKEIAALGGVTKALSAKAAQRIEKNFKYSNALKELKKTPKELMEFVKMMSPTDVKLTDLKVDGKKATLSMTGKSDGQMMKGTADLVEENGQWKIGKQDWSNAK